MLDDGSFRDILQRAHAALGFTEGFTHTEFRLTPLGPKVIEMNPRLGGDLIPYLGKGTTGIDPALAAAAVAVGRRPGRPRTQGVRCGPLLLRAARDDHRFDGFDPIGCRTGGIGDNAGRTGRAARAAAGRLGNRPDRRDHRGR